MTKFHGGRPDNSALRRENQRNGSKSAGASTTTTQGSPDAGDLDLLLISVFCVADDLLARRSAMQDAIRATRRW